MDYGTDPISSISPDPTLETCVAHTPTKKKKKLSATLGLHIL